MKIRKNLAPSRFCLQATDHLSSPRALLETQS
jgi:hypothetical protein